MSAAVWDTCSEDEMLREESEDGVYDLDEDDLDEDKLLRSDDETGIASDCDNDQSQQMEINEQINPCSAQDPGTVSLLNGTKDSISALTDPLPPKLISGDEPVPVETGEDEATTRSIDSQTVPLCSTEATVASRMMSTSANEDNVSFNTEVALSPNPLNSASSSGSEDAEEEVELEEAEALTSSMEASEVPQALSLVPGLSGVQETCTIKVQDKNVHTPDLSGPAVHVPTATIQPQMDVSRQQPNTTTSLTPPPKPHGLRPYEHQSIEEIDKEEKSVNQQIDDAYRATRQNCELLATERRQNLNLRKQLGRHETTIEELQAELLQLRQRFAPTTTPPTVLRVEFDGRTLTFDLANLINPQ
eukprot:GHVU01089239.1.p1 GENE.GHVU01089239.1~~GHVU01089239.1.p1  ORF type:complete len:360 (+),score=50.53 GHVU01089239.1:101-1180(+)